MPERFGFPAHDPTPKKSPTHNLNIVRMDGGERGFSLIASWRVEGGNVSLFLDHGYKLVIIGLQKKNNLGAISFMTKC